MNHSLDNAAPLYCKPDLSEPAVFAIDLADQQPHVFERFSDARGLSRADQTSFAYIRQEGFAALPSELTKKEPAVRRQVLCLDPLLDDANQTQRFGVVLIGTPTHLVEITT